MKVSCGCIFIIAVLGLYISCTGGGSESSFLATSSIQSKNIMIVGDSLSYNITKYLSCPVDNRSAPGWTAPLEKNVAGQQAVSRPDMVFIMLGINDLIGDGNTPEIISDLISDIVDIFHSVSPDSVIFIESVLPVTDEITGGRIPGNTALSRNTEISDLNTRLKKLCAGKNIAFINLYDSFLDSSTGKMKISYTFDGIHLTPAGYVLFADLIKQLIRSKVILALGGEVASFLQSQQLGFPLISIRHPSYFYRAAAEHDKLSIVKKELENQLHA